MSEASFGLLQAFSTPKSEDSINEDQWHVSEDGKIVALCDGATISYDSRGWAEVLAKGFVIDQSLGLDWLRAAITDYSVQIDREGLSWSAQAAFDRGSFSTLAGIICDNSGQAARVFAIGDSLVVLVDQDQLLRSYPYSDAEQFDLVPTLMSSAFAQNAGMTDEDFTNWWIDLNFSGLEKPRVMMTTDALGRWLLDCPAERVPILLGIGNHSDFESLVQEERRAGRMRRDDTTLLVLGVAG